MLLPEIEQKIFESDDFVISELKKIQTLYKLKNEIRYGQTRNTEEDSESVAEHIYGMHCLMDYFQLFEDKQNSWNQERTRLMIQYHDIDEIETGDVIGYLKSEFEKENERKAVDLVIKKLPHAIQEKIKLVLNEYELQKTPESRFVKALDKIEPVFHLYDEKGLKILTKNKTTKDQNDRIKFPYMQDFPFILRFAEVMTTQFEREGFYHPET